MTNKRPVNSFDNNDSQDNVHGRKVTPSEVSYRDGYVEGQSVERSQVVNDQYAREEIRESNGVANGLVLGLVFAALVGLVAGGLYFTTRNETNTAPVAAPASPQPQRNTTIIERPQPQRNTTIIERTIERTKEAAPPVQAPDVQINVPQPAPAPATSAPAPAAPAPAAPAPAAPPSSDSSNSEPSATESNSANDSSEQPSGASENPSGKASGNPAQ